MVVGSPPPQLLVWSLVWCVLDTHKAYITYSIVYVTYRQLGTLSMQFIYLNGIVCRMGARVHVNEEE